MSSPLLEVRGLTRHFAADSVRVRPALATAMAAIRAVDGVDFDIAPGETFALVGESGKPESRHWRAAWSVCCTPTAGSVVFRGRRMQMIFQNP